MTASWTEVTIGEIADIVGGSTPSTKDPDNFGGDIPWVTPKDLSGPHDRYIARGERNLTQQGLDSCSAKLLPAGAVLLSTRAPVGYVAIAKNPIATNQGFRSLIPRDGAFGEYLYYWLSVNTEELERHSSGSTFRELSGTALKSIKLRLPPMGEQRRIAGVLGCLDDKIELNRRMAGTLEEMARALFRSWFVDFEPVRAKQEGRWRSGESLPGLPAQLYEAFPERLEASALGPIPAGWRVAALGDVVEVNPRRSLKKGEAAPHLAMADMPTHGHVPHAVTERPFGSGTRFINGDTLVARITPCLENGKTAYVDFLEDGQVGWGSTEYIVLRPKPPLPPEFAYCLARSEPFREFAIQSMTGTSGRQRVPPAAVASYVVAVPPTPASSRFAAEVGPLIARATKAGTDTAAISVVRNSLSRQLLATAGEIQESTGRVSQC